MDNITKQLTDEKAKVEAEIKQHKDKIFTLTAKSKQLQKAIDTLNPITENPITDKDVYGSDSMY